MIFFVGNDGTIVKGMPAQVYQGSANANSIYLIAPFAENMTVQVAFRLPNGVAVPRATMTPQAEIPGIINQETGQPYSGWSYALPSDITEYYGTVLAQFYFYAAQEGVVTASSAAAFQVSRGVPEINPPDPSADEWENIEAILSSLQSDLHNGYYASRAIYAWNSKFTYGANEIVYYAKENSEGAFVKSIADGNKGNEPYVNGTLDGTHWVQVVNFDEIAQGATIQVGTVTTGEPGTPASVTNVGTARAAIFDFTIPKGASGVTGAGVYGFEIEDGNLVLYSQEEESPESTYQIRTDGTLTITFN